MVDDKQGGADGMLLVGIRQVEGDAPRSALLTNDRRSHRSHHTLRRHAEHRAERRRVRHGDLGELQHNYHRRWAM